MIDPWLKKILRSKDVKKLLFTKHWFICKLSAQYLNQSEFKWWAIIHQTFVFVFTKKFLNKNFDELLIIKNMKNWTYDLPLIRTLNWILFWPKRLLHKLMKNSKEYQALPKLGTGQRPAASSKKQFIHFVL